MVDIVEEAEGKVLMYATGADVGGVETGAGDALVEFLRLSSMYVLGGGLDGSDQARHTISFSRSSNPQRNGVKAPTSIAWLSTLIK